MGRAANARCAGPKPVGILIRSRSIRGVLEDCQLGEIGQGEILERQAHESWGSRVIDRLSADLRHDFPDMTGLSARNLKYMRALAEAHPDREFVQQVVARLPWSHVVRLLETVKDPTRCGWEFRPEFAGKMNFYLSAVDDQLRKLTEE